MNASILSLVAVYFISINSAYAQDSTPTDTIPDDEFNPIEIITDEDSELILRIGPSSRRNVRFYAGAQTNVINSPNITNTLPSVELEWHINYRYIPTSDYQISVQLRGYDQDNFYGNGQILFKPSGNFRVGPQVHWSPLYQSYFIHLSAVADSANRKTGEKPHRIKIEPIMGIGVTKFDTKKAYHTDNWIMKDVSGEWINLHGKNYFLFTMTAGLQTNIETKHGIELELKSWNQFLFENAKGVDGVYIYNQHIKLSKRIGQLPISLFIYADYLAFVHQKGKIKGRVEPNEALPVESIELKPIKNLNVGGGLRYEIRYD